MSHACRRGQRCRCGLTSEAAIRGFRLYGRADEPPARWHDSGNGPANHFAGTVVSGRSFCGTKGSRLQPGSRCAMPATDRRAARHGHAAPGLLRATHSATGSSDPACQMEAGKPLIAQRRNGTTELAGAGCPAARAAGQPSSAPLLQPAVEASAASGAGFVWMLFGACAATGWIAVGDGSLPAPVLTWVRPLGTCRRRSDDRRNSGDTDLQGPHPCCRYVDGPAGGCRNIQPFPSESLNVA